MFNRMAGEKTGNINKRIEYSYIETSQHKIWLEAKKENIQTDQNVPQKLRWSGHRI
jgi:hypothetical protein